MPWTGPDPYGTAGGADSDTLPLSPADIRTYRGRSAILFLQRNGPLTTVPRSSVEDIIRTLDAGGGSVVRFRIRDDGQIIDDNVFDWEVFDFSVAHIGSGEDQISMGNNIVTNAKLADASISTAKFANLAATPAKLSQSYREGTRTDFPVLSYEMIVFDGSVLTAPGTGPITYRTPVNAIVLPTNNMKYAVEVFASFVINEASGGLTLSFNGGLTLNGADQSFVNVQDLRGGSNAFATLRFSQMTANLQGPLNVAGVVLFQNGSVANQIQSARIRLRAFPQIGGITWP